MLRGQPVPEWLEQEPLLYPGDEFYISAFYELSTCRQLGFSMGPIPWRDIMAYMDFAELDPVLVPVFVRSIRAMDAVYIEWAHKKIPKSEKPHK